jgi:hypothetical protein
MSRYVTYRSNRWLLKIPVSSILDNSPLEDFIITTQMESDEAEVVKVHDHDAYLSEPTTRNFQSIE